MKTLDKVIKALECCCEVGLCESECPYHNDCGNDEEKADALHYLKAYKDDKDDLTALRAYWKEQHENNALTWEQLKQMVGKPVWVVVDGKERWRIVREVSSEHLILESGLPLHRCWLNHPDGWQAYRKEK